MNTPYVQSYANILRLCIYAIALFVATNHLWAEEREIASGDLRDWNDERLKNSFTKHFINDPKNEEDFEYYLTEIVRRKNKDFIDVLKKCVEARKLPSLNDRSNIGHNVESLTALRRLQGKNDPLDILIETSDNKIVATPLTLPRIKVAVKNIDVEKRPVLFKNGGDYRTGRQTRWRIIVIDGKGKLVPTRPSSSVVAGGTFTHDALGHEKSWETTVAIRDFLGMPAVGKYSMTVIYHNESTILNTEEDALPHYIYSTSKPIQLTIEKVVIEQTTADITQAKKLVEELDDKKPLKVVAGLYGKWAHDFVKPDSPEAKLMVMGLKALPTLVSELQNKDLTATKRAWLFSTLFTISGEFDPRDGRALPGYTYMESGWQIWGNDSDKPNSYSGGIGFSGEGTVSGGEIDVKEQDQLTNKWAEWLKTCDVKTIEKM